jgi:hypothetical protein
MNRDIEETSPETRAAHASNWENDWYNVVEDVHHCTQFVMIDEIADLLTDGLKFVSNNGRLSDFRKTEWMSIIEDVKAGPTGRQDLAGTIKAQQYLTVPCKKLLVLMSEIK